ncbi:MULTISPECIES: PP2C family protein-serine/threonine phosphatase [unclassified Curtobacterium]|uniref:PP2C family protein-serine/threonine phosphatase n=1 Tax=unclassified Curtobacterium TaxID=257496 RepID=UPI0008DD72DA|nr:MULTISPECIES: GAF domain-containing protein [unclassified Curtobacterium]WIA96737.1 GAF domain-containing protein [Curtobacterium sp. MCBA15_004]WIB00041.1 GAF domain-containing protein [Curtobacterium sp. MCBA15_012]
MDTPNDDGAARRTAVIEALDVLGAGPEERFDRITRMTHEAFGVPLTFLNLVHHDLVTTQSTFGWQQGTSVPASEQFCATTVLTPEPMVIPDTTLDPRFAHTAAVAEHGIRFYAGAPLSTGDGIRVGTLCVMDAQPRVFADEDVALLRDLARWAERELGHSIERGRVQRVLAGLVPVAVAVPGAAVEGLVLPRERGGDVVDWRVAADGSVHATVGTVAAGRASALLAASLRSAVVARTDVAFDDAVAGLEAQLGPDLTAADAVGSLLHLRLDPSSGHLAWTGAGPGTALLLRADGDGTGEVVPLRSADLPIGLQPAGHPRTTGTTTLAPGDRVVLATPGALALGGIAGEDGLAALAAAHPDDLLERLRTVASDDTADRSIAVVVLTRR